MKLYEIPRNTRIKILDENSFIPPGALLIEKGDILAFSHIDGMYSVCYKNNILCHLMASTNVELLPMHKFNNGIGATLCNKCHAIISTGFTNSLFCSKCFNKLLLINENKKKSKL